jgi:hypothetical protein
VVPLVLAAAWWVAFTIAALSSPRPRPAWLRHEHRSRASHIDAFDAVLNLAVLLLCVVSVLLVLERGLSRQGRRA